MTEILAHLGAALFQAGVFAALIMATPVLYGLVVVMHRWWLVLATALVMLGLVEVLSFDSPLHKAMTSLPEAMVPSTQGYAMVAFSYVMLAVVVRLSTLRLEWLGWKQKSIKDIHVLGYLTPTLAAIALIRPVL